MIAIITFSAIIILISVTASVRVALSLDHKVCQFIASSLFGLFLSLFLMFFLVVVYSLLLCCGEGIGLQSFSSLIILLLFLPGILTDISIITCRLCI